jgi:DNA-binding response OmpR family regulator
MDKETEGLNRREVEGTIRTAQRRETGSLRIVLVNDERCLLEMLDLIIRSWFKDVTVLMFYDAVGALEELSRTDPDLLITDDKMAGMGGLELCQRLFDKRVTYPIIMTSSYSPTEQRVREFAAQGLNVSYFVVPFDVSSLRRLIELSLKITIQGEEAQQPATLTSRGTPVLLP